MSTASSQPCLPRGAGLLLVVLLFVVARPVVARAEGPSPHPPRISPPGDRAVAADLGAAAASGEPVVLAGAWKSFTHFLESTLNNRRRMLQFGVLGMCLALYIMIWRR